MSQIITIVTFEHLRLLQCRRLRPHGAPKGRLMKYTLLFVMSCCVYLNQILEIP